MPELPPGVLANLNVYIYIFCTVSALIAPILRALIRRFNKLQPLFLYQNVKHDVHAGFLAPLLLVMVIAPIFPELMKHLDPKAMALAGITGLLEILKDMFDHNNHNGNGNGNNHDNNHLKRRSDAARGNSPHHF